MPIQSIGFTRGRVTTQITTYYLEMTDPSELRSVDCAGTPLEIRRAEIASPELNRFLYTAVGGDWFWIDRLAWTHDDWLAYLSRDALETWVAYQQGTPAGYYEIESRANYDVEIAYFGLLPAFMGRGFGKRLLSHAIARGWERGARRVWVHTCTLDGPNALSNYQARGMRLYKQETQKVEIPLISPGPWLGARSTGNHG